MPDQPRGPMKDTHYDLIWVLEASLKNNRKAGEQGKRMLLERLQREG